VGKAKVEINYNAVGALLRSPEIVEHMAVLAAEIEGRCGDGYAIDAYNGDTRLVMSVYTDSTAAMLDNLENNTLLKAVR